MHCLAKMDLFPRFSSLCMSPVPKSHPVESDFFLWRRNTYRNCAETARLGCDCDAALQHLMLRWLRALIWVFFQNNCRNKDLKRLRPRNLLRRNFDSGLLHNIENPREDFSDFFSTCDCLKKTLLKVYRLFGNACFYNYFLYEWTRLIKIALPVWENSYPSGFSRGKI